MRDKNMRKRTTGGFSLILLCLVIMATANAQEHKKLAQAGFEFLSVVSDARGAAMADAMTSLQMASTALFYNPAGMAEMTKFVDVAASTNHWIADITHNTLSLSINPARGRYGVFGVSLQSVDYGEFYGTQVDKSSTLGYVDTGIFKLTSMAVGMGYAKQLTDRFSVGGQVRWVRQDLGESVIPVGAIEDSTTQSTSNELTPFAFDFGTQFKTDFKDLVFGMSIRNFSNEIRYAEEGFQLPLVFNLGISMDLMSFFEHVPYDQSLYFSIDASHYRSHPEQLKFALEYQALNVLFLRGGYVTNNDENGFTFGFGVSHFGISLDYAYTPFGVFDNVRRMTARFSL
jgi:hypothetical protein